MRLIRALGWLLATAFVLVVVALAGFRVAAALRETETSEQAAGESALFVEADGLKLHYRSWGPETGPALLLVPGTMAWSETFRDIAGPLGDKGFRVISPDMPPFGYSTRPADSDFSRAAQARRLLAFADALKLDRFALGVHSYGGGGAIEAAFLAPERIEALILLDVAIGLGRTEKPEPPLASVMEVDALRDIVVSATFTNPLLIGKGLRDFIADDTLATDERIALYARPLDMAGSTEAIGDWLMTGLYGDERGARSADLAAYEAFNSPVLVIWGRDDTVTPLDQGEAIAAAFQTARLEVLDGVNHIPHVERPDAVVTLIETFLASANGPTEPKVAEDKEPRLRPALP